MRVVLKFKTDLAHYYIKDALDFFKKSQNIKVLHSFEDGIVELQFTVGSLHKAFVHVRKIKTYLFIAGADEQGLIAFKFSDEIFDLNLKYQFCNNHCTFMHNNENANIVSKRDMDTYFSMAKRIVLNDTYLVFDDFIMQTFKVKYEI